MLIIRKEILFSIFFILCVNKVIGQDKNYISLELAGSGGFGSLNYERPILPQTNLNLNLRFGFSFSPIDKNNGSALIFPVIVHWLVGKNAHKLDVGIGQTLTITTKGQPFISAPLVVGYRYQPLDKNYFFRAAYTPLVSYLFGIQLQNWAGLTYGYHFNRKK